MLDTKVQSGFIDGEVIERTVKNGTASIINFWICQKIRFQIGFDLEFPDGKFVSLSFSFHFLVPIEPIGEWTNIKLIEYKSLWVSKVWDESSQLGSKMVKLQVEYARI